NEYLLETYRCAYLSSGRDLLRPEAARAKGTVVFAGPDYKLGAAERLARAEKLLAKKEALAMRSASAGELRSVGWKALPGAAEDGAGAGWARSRLKHLDNPLLRSGIVLAGANTIGDKETAARVEDGWVTAEEIALLNLRGTELVVLSACQTGLGDVKSGEGVFGLRRAFLYAGAETLVTSLFEVPDSETRALMTRFYTGLRAG